MPQGIVISSGSTDTKPGDLEKFLESKGYEVEKPEVPAEEPQRDAFETDEEFTTAHEAWKAAQPEPAKKDEKESDEEKEFLEATEPKKKSKFQKRIDKLLAPYQRRIAELEAKTPKEPETKTEETPRPKRADFQSDDEYEDALLAWGTKKALAEQAAKDAEQENRATFQAHIDNYNEAKEEFAAEHEDWEEVIGSSKAAIPQHVQFSIYEMDNGPAVVYHLATHPEVAEKLTKLTPLSAVMEVGRLSEKLKAASGKPGSGAGGEEPQKPKPKLPAPIRPLSTSATTSTLTARSAAEKGDFSAFKAARRAGR